MQEHERFFGTDYLGRDVRCLVLSIDENRLNIVVSDAR